jgi:hypothetical protein
MPKGFFDIVEGFVEGPSRSNALLAPPAGFRAAAGVRSAWPCGIGPFGRTPPRGGSAAQRAGRRYEAKALAMLARTLGDAFTASQWFRFLDNSGIRWCQVDGLSVSNDGITIYEIKTTFCPEAWWQLRRLYEPVVKRAFCVASLRLVIICKSFDPAVVLPESFELLDEFPLAPPPGRVVVYPWRS